MPDWQTIVQQHFADAQLPKRWRAEIILELSAHLEDEFAVLRERLPEEEAEQRARELLDDPRFLMREIGQVEQEGSMTQSTRAVWLPGLTVLAAYWLVAISLGVYLMRTGAFFRTGTVLFGGVLVSLSLGAIGAWWARTNGATKLQRAVVSVFPVFLSLAGFVVGPVLSLAQGKPGLFPFHGDVDDVLVKGVLFPAAGLLLGAVPFLRNGGKPHSSPLRGEHA